MAITLQNGTSGLFDVLGKVFHAQSTLATAALTTVPDEVIDAIEQFNLVTVDLDLEQTIADLAPSTLAWQQGSSSLMAALQRFATDYLVEIAAADVLLNPKTVDAALAELIAQMIGAGSISNPDDDVDASTIGLTATPYASNVGTGTVVVSTKRGDGQVNQYTLAETIIATVTSEDNTASATLSLVGDASVDDKLAYNWPGGSGVSGQTLTATYASGGLLGADGGMDVYGDAANVPDGWILSVGTPGTTIKATTVEVQTIAISGTPSSGTYCISYTNLSSKVQVTDKLAYNATASEVQTALRALVGLEDVTVTATGTSPDFTHTITFLGAGGNQSQFTIVNNTTGGTITPGTTTAGTAHVLRGSRALEFDSNGSQLTEIWYPLAGQLTPKQQLAFCAWMKTDSVPAAGVLTVDLYDGSAVIADDFGTSNSFTVAATGLTTSFVAKTGVFRLPTNLPPVVYLRIRISTAVSNTSSVFIDEVSLKEMTEIYPGGPSAAAFCGGTPFVAGDYFTLAATNNRAGLLGEWMDRNFDLAGRGLVLPNDTGGTETVPDSCVG